MANPGHGNPPGAWLDAPLLRHSSLPEISRARRLSGLSLTTFTSSQVQDGLLRKSTPTIDRPLVYRSLWAQDHRLQEYRPAYDSCTSSWILLEYTPATMDSPLQHLRRATLRNIGLSCRCPAQAKPHLDPGRDHSARARDSSLTATCLRRTRPVDH